VIEITAILIFCHFYLHYNLNYLFEYQTQKCKLTMNLTKKYQIIFLKFNKLIPKNKLEEKTKILMRLPCFCPDLVRAAPTLLTNRKYTQIFSFSLQFLEKKFYSENQRTKINIGCS